MMIPRRVRAIFGIATTWGTAFAALATTMAVGAIALDYFPSHIATPGIVLAIGIRGFITGAISGTIFATVFARAERRQTLATLSTRRVALWGFIGGAAVPAAFAVGFSIAGFLPVSVAAVSCLAYGAIGSALSAAMVTIARRAPAIAAESGAV